MKYSFFWCVSPRSYETNTFCSSDTFTWTELTFKEIRASDLIPHQKLSIDVFFVNIQSFVRIFKAETIKDNYHNY
jgi:hypothetical protein